MLDPDNILDTVEETGYRIRKAPTEIQNSQVILACTFPNESLLATATTDGLLNIQDLESKQILLTLELHLMASITPGTATPSTSHRLNRAWSNMITLNNRMVIFNIHHSNQLLLTSLSNKHTELFGDQVCLLGSHEVPVTTLCVDEKRTVLASGDSSGKIRLWPLSWEALQSEHSRWKPKPISLPSFQGHYEHVVKVAFVEGQGSTPSKFVSIGGEYGVVKVWALSPDHQTIHVSMFQTLDCGGSYVPRTLSACADLCAMGTECGKVFVWDHEELELLMVGEDSEGIECLSVHRSAQSVCVCGNKVGSVRIFRPHQVSHQWELMAECYLGGQVLINQFVHDSLVLLSGETSQNLTGKYWTLSELPSTPVQTQDTSPQPRKPPPLPIPATVSLPPTHPSRVPESDAEAFEEVEIEDVIAVDNEVGESDIVHGEFDTSEPDSIQNVERQHNRKKEVQDGQAYDLPTAPRPTQHNQAVQLFPTPPSHLSSAKLNSTARLKQEYVDAQRETFYSKDELNDESKKYAARLPNVPLEDQSRYVNLENLNPVLPTPKQSIKKQIDPKWAHQVKSYVLQDEDYYLPDWGDDPQPELTLKSSGAELLEKMRKGYDMDSDPVWRAQTALILNLCSSAPCPSQDK